LIFTIYRDHQKHPEKNIKKEFGANYKLDLEITQNLLNSQLCKSKNCTGRAESNKKAKIAFLCRNVHRDQ
jgi:hypothetical protein